MAKRYFHWDPVHDCVVQESDADGNTLVDYTREPTSYGPLISEHRDDEEYVHHYDALGSTTMLTDETGSVTDTFTYDAWGNQVARTGTTETPYRWCGRWGYQYDEPTGGYYVRARTYQPTIARWASVDPLCKFIIGVEYPYSDNNPIDRLDPSGLRWQPYGPGPLYTVFQALDDGDSLEDLAQLVTGNKKDWVCIWPLYHPELRGWRGTYPLAEQCAFADISNLQQPIGLGPKLALYPEVLASPTLEDRVLKAVFSLYNENYAMPEMPSWGFNGAKKIAEVSRLGATPIEILVAGGHCGLSGVSGVNEVGGLGAHHFWMHSPVARNSFNTLFHAAKREGPPRCWFTRNAKIYGFGCSSGAVWMPDMASEIARDGAQVFGTKNTVWGAFDPAPYLTLVNRRFPRRQRNRLRDIPELINSPLWDKKMGNA